MLELRLPTGEQLKQIYERDLKPAFPAAELKPLREMLWETERGEYRPWCLFDGEAIVGEAFVWTVISGFALFDYLCVSQEKRNDGLGSLMIRRLTEAERSNVLFGEAEIPRFAADPALAERRLGFYRRNGARRAEYDSCVFGVPYHTLFWAERDVSREELMEAHAAAYRSAIPRQIYSKYIVIPWDDSMERPDTIPWFAEREKA